MEACNVERSEPVPATAANRNRHHTPRPPDPRWFAATRVLVIAVITANINPTPAIAGRDVRPAGIIRIIIDGTTKAEREEIAVVESRCERHPPPLIAR